MSNIKLPFKLCTNRVSYLIPGGTMIDAFYGIPPKKDNMDSQAWIASVVESTIGQPGTGLSRLKSEFGGVLLKDLLQEHSNELLGRQHVMQYGPNPGVLIKLLHSDNRLLVQVHPDKEKAMRYFNSPFGKTEAWYIVDVKGSSASIFAGFKPHVTKELFRSLIEHQDTAGLINCLHEFKVSSGDVIFIPAGVPHALGADALVLEIQEPTDITLRAERIRPDGSVLPEESLHSGIGMDGLLDCFNFDTQVREKTEKRIIIQPKIIHVEEGINLKKLITKDTTFCFSMCELTLEQNKQISCKNDRFAVALVLIGNGTIKTGVDSIAVKKGDEIFIPHTIEEYTYFADNPLVVLECYPPSLKE